MVNKAVLFLKEAWEELKKIAWPTRDQALRSTGAVLAVTFGIAAFTAVLDYIFSFLLNFFVTR